MKAIFLDIDGVMNSTDWLKRQTKPVARCEDMWDPDCTVRLNRLIDRTGAVIVVSSTWRRIFNTRTAMCDVLTSKGVVCKLLGLTPTSGPRRGNEIMAFLNSVTGKNITHFVALDDDRDLEAVEEHFLHIDGRVGLTDADVEGAIKILEKPRKK